jgi:hypothetical protein
MAVWTVVEMWAQFEHTVSTPAPSRLGAPLQLEEFFFLLISFLSLLVKQSKGGPSWTPKGWGLASPTVSH